MGDGTKLNAGVTGDLIDTEDLGARGKIQRTKLALGALDVDGGDIASGNALPVTQDTAIAGEDTVNNKLVVEQRYSFITPITTATTTVVKSAPGYIDELIVAGGTLGNVTIYDNTSAAGAVIFPTITPIAGQVLIKHVNFSIGLTIVTAAATAIVGSYR